MKALIASTTLAVLTLLAPAQEVSEESLAAAERLMETMGVREEMAIAFKAAMEPMLQPMIQQMGLNAEQVDELNAIFTSWWEDDIDQDAIVSEYKKLYAKTFTESELKELELFYQTPLGKKMIVALPELTQQGMQIGMDAAAKQEGALTAKIEAFTEKVMKDMMEEDEVEEEDPAKVVPIPAEVPSAE